MEFGLDTIEGLHRVDPRQRGLPDLRYYPLMRELAELREKAQRLATLEAPPPIDDYSGMEPPAPDDDTDIPQHGPDAYEGPR